MIRVKLLIFVTLIFDVLSYHRFIAVFADRAGEITIRPKLSTPELPLYLRTTPENFTRRQTLHQRHDLRNTVRRHRLNQKVDVIFVRPNLQKLHLVALRDCQADRLEFLINAFVKHHASVFRRKNQVVQQNRDIVALV